MMDLTSQWFAWQMKKGHLVNGEGDVDCGGRKSTKLMKQATSISCNILLNNKMKRDKRQRLSFTKCHSSDEEWA